MKSAATIFVLVILVSIQTPIGQFFKIPLLIEHFIKHQKENGISLFVFLADHYATDHKDADFPEDEELPFKNITFHSIGYAIVTPMIQVNGIIPFPFDKKMSCPHTYTPKQLIAGIFHPPRV